MSANYVNVQFEFHDNGAIKLAHLEATNTNVVSIVDAFIKELSTQQVTVKTEAPTKASPSSKPAVSVSTTGGTYDN